MAIDTRDEDWVIYLVAHPLQRTRRGAEASCVELFLDLGGLSNEARGR